MSKQFVTMIEPTYDETKTKLNGWVPPRGAFVLFETTEVKYSLDGSKRIGHDLFTLNVDNRPMQAAKLQHYLKKGFKILHYGNFPSLSDPNTADKARLHSEGGKRPHWDILKSEVNHYMQMDPLSKGKLEKTVEELRQELAEEKRKSEAFAMKEAAFKERFAAEAAEAAAPDESLREAPKKANRRADA